ncbi:1-acyl-sn-glycerol-3-phosphate acyltransferase [Segatella paludivivens]|uniref:1-acyl-sn-glycerol-3-phosphate acyltransferase n=1 Tax=Segatella paludivivens TaxID=185294 RepID=UPI0003999FAB|nr:1-acyl-sn-glycerol-3-phosphate acyltransferase [Segatella paludivivens]
MIIPKEFDDIRPWEEDDLPEAYDRLLSNEQFESVLAYLYPGVPFDVVAKKMRSCKNGYEFQLAFSYDFVGNVLKKGSTGSEMDSQNIDNTKRYTFVSNHRDIVLDSAILDKFLIDAKFTTTCEIAIGDNLLSLPWIKDLVRVNKSFIVERGLPMRQMLMSSKLLSDYMHFAINEKHENIWIAQREGRAKDSNDRTQEAVLKMMAMGGNGSIVERLKNLHIVPLAISYEYDPCDFLKAREFQLKRDIEGWKKEPQDDIVSMQTGIIGHKGHVHYQCAKCIDDFLDTIAVDVPKTDIYRIVAEHIDKSIYKGYMLYPGNYVALDILNGATDFANKFYTQEQKALFETYIAGQLAKIELPSKDEDFLRERMLTMYANPLRNYLSVR